MRNWQSQLRASLLISGLTLTIQSCGLPKTEEPQGTQDDWVQELNRCTLRAANEVAAELSWYKPRQQFDRKAFLEGMYGGPNPHQDCVDQLISDYLDLWMESCMKYHCGEDIAGGCVHLAGLREGGPVHSALSHCRQLESRNFGEAGEERR